MLTEIHGAKVWIGVPTVDGRDDALASTVKALSTAVAQPTVYRSSLPLGLDNLRCSQRLMLSDAINTGAALLHVEDDVIISVSRLRRALLKSLSREYSERIFTFYLPGKRFYPRRVERMIGQAMVETTFRIVGAQQYWGSQCVLIPSKLIPSKLVSKALSIATNRQVSQLDMVIRDVAPIWSVIPNPVQHRDLTPSWSPRGHRHQSISYAE